MYTRLTVTKLNALTKRPPKERTDVHDGQVPGLMIRVTPRGTLTWSYQFRLTGAGGVTGRGHSLKGNGRHRVTIGRYPEISLAEARKVASDYNSLTNKGLDPRMQLEVEATAAKNTIENLVKQFMKKHVEANNLRSAWKIRMAFDTHILPKLGTRSASSITRRDARLLIEVASQKRKRKDGRYEGGPEAARTTREVLFQLFEWACERDLVTANPIAGLKDLVRKQSRDRVLTMEELLAIWAAATMIPYPFGPMVRLLMLSACRRGEWAAARWPWITWNEHAMEIPSENYKSKRVHVVPLSTPALEILKATKRWPEGDYIFSGTKGVKPVSGFSRAKSLLDKAVETELEHPLENWRLHDIRRSIATHLRRLGVERQVVKHILGHGDRDATAIYDRYTLLPERRNALQMWAEELTAK